MDRLIIFTGAQGTGKTTVLNFFKEHGFDVITEVVRKMAKEEGIHINESGDDDGQQRIFNKYVDILSDAKGVVISDRGLTDVTAYSMYLNEKKGEDVCSSWRVSSQLEDTEAFLHEKNPIVFYFPVSFDVVDDGVRSTDREFQAYIDNAIHEILEASGHTYNTVPSDYTKRIRFISDVLAEYGIMTDWSKGPIVDPFKETAPITWPLQ